MGAAACEARRSFFLNMDIKDPLICPLQVFMSHRVQLGDVLAGLLEFTGPARLTVSTFSCGEEFLMRLHKLKQKGLVLSAALYADMKAAEKTARIRTMMMSVYDEFYLCANHSKVMLVEGERMTVCVLSSQNQTRGNRMESYVLLRSPEAEEIVRTAFLNLKTASPWK